MLDGMGFISTQFKTCYVIGCTCIPLLQVVVIVDAKPKALGLPTDAYYAVEEVHDVSVLQPITTYNCN